MDELNEKSPKKNRHSESGVMDSFPDRQAAAKGTYTQQGGGLMLQGYTMAIVPCGNPTPKKLPTSGGERPTSRTARAQRTVRPLCPCISARCRQAPHQFPSVFHQHIFSCHLGLGIVFLGKLVAVLPLVATSGCAGVQVMIPLLLQRICLIGCLNLGPWQFASWL